MSNQVEVSELPTCDICRIEGIETEAMFDAKTIDGPWAYMCQKCFNGFGVGLGTGLGQRLILKK